MEKWLDLTAENLAEESLCCIVRKKPHPGVEAKRAWLRERLAEGHVFRKIPGEACAFLEFAPLESAWVPALGENYLYLYCLWVDGSAKGKGCGTLLMESLLSDARAQGKSGVCMLGSGKQKAWLSDQSFAARFGFETADETPGGYRLLARSLDGTLPRFAPNAKRETIDDPRLTIFYDFQCPFLFQRVEKLQAACGEDGIPAVFRPVDSLATAKALPCPFNNWAVFYGGTFRTVNQLDRAGVARLLKK